MIRFFVDDNELVNFLNQILETEGFQDLDPELIDAARNELLMQLEDDTATFIAENLDLLDAEELGKLTKQGARQEVQRFIEKKIPEATKRISDLLVAFRNFYAPYQDVVVQ